MRRRSLITAAGTATAGLLAGCTSIAGEEPAAGDVHVEELGVEQVERNTIRVSGAGSVETAPDTASFSVSVAAHDRDDASAVIEELADRADRLRDALLDYGVPDANITTERYSLREHSRRNRYEGEHRYAVEVDDPDAVGDVIDVCADAGADSISRISFGISEERREALYDEAVTAAVEDARTEAELYTEAAGQTLGEPTSIETTETGHSPFRQEYDMAVAEDADSAPATQIDEGQVSVNARVTIEYEFESASG